MAAQPARRLGELALLLLALCVNLSPFAQAFVEGRVSFPISADELYHMRRVWYEVVRFPERLEFDPYLNFPDGARPVWPFLFDWLVASVARLLVGAQDQAAVERVAAFVPPLLGAANVVAVARLVARLFSLRAGLFAGALLALLPAYAHNAQLAMLDHHVAVALATTLLLSCGVELLGARPRARVAALGGVTIAVGLLLSPGFLLQALMLEAVALAQVLLCADRATATTRARSLALLLGLAAVLLIPSCVGQPFPDLGPFSPLVLSRFQPIWFGGGALGLFLSAVLWRSGAAGSTRARRLASALALALAGLVAALASLDGLLAAIRGAGGWFMRQGECLATVEELRPLLWPHDGFDPRVAHFSLSLFFWAFPVAWLWLVWQRGLRVGSAPIWLVLTASASFFAANLAQQRFGDLFALCGVIVLAAPFEALAERVGRMRERRSRIVAWLGLLAAISLALSPCVAYHRNPRAASLAGRGRERIDEVADWLRRNTPPTRGYLDAAQRPEYGVLAAWGDGHRIRYRAERPVVQDNFGEYAGRRNYSLAGEYYRSTDEERAYEIARRLGVRYVVATPRGSGHGPVPVGSMTWRLAVLLGSAAPAGDVSALGRHRLVHLSRGLRSRVALYELLPGALVTGAAPAGEELSFELTLRNDSGASRLYRATTHVGRDGRYELRLPYSTERPLHSSVSAASSYRVRCGARVAELTLSERDVQEGRTAAGPSW